MNRTTTAVAVGLALAVSACSSSSSAGGAGTDFPPCSATEELHIRGTLKGMPVDISEATASGGYVNLGSATFSTPFGVAGDDAGAGVETLMLAWTGPVADGSSAPATGTFTMTASDPLGAVTLCAGSGSEVVFPASGSPFEFVLQNLTLGPGCTQPVSGQLEGCWASTH